jgi:hypothetical protein
MHISAIVILTPDAIAISKIYFNISKSISKEMKDALVDKLKKK